MLYRHVDELLNFGERYDFIELAVDLSLGHAQDSAGEERVLPPREFRMETRSDLQQTSHSPINLRPARSWPRDPTQNLQQRRLPRAVPSDQPQHFAAPYLQIHVLQCPEHLPLFSLQQRPWGSQDRSQYIPERIFPLPLPYPVQLAESFRLDRDLAHLSSDFLVLHLFYFRSKLQSHNL